MATRSVVNGVKGGMDAAQVRAASSSPVIAYIGAVDGRFSCVSLSTDNLCIMKSRVPTDRSKGMPCRFNYLCVVVSSP